MSLQSFQRIRASVLVCGLCFLTDSRASETASVRSLSLMECVRIALEHNLEVKIARLTPEIRRHTLESAYGVYEPSLDLAGTHHYNASPGGIDDQNRSYPGTITERDLYRAGLNVFLPTGLRLNLGGDLSSTEGVNPFGPFENSSGAASMQLRQPLLKNLWIDGSRLTIAVNKKLLQVSELALRQEIMSTVTAVELAYYDLLLARERVKVQEQALQLADRLVFESRRRVEAGTLARLDEKQAESQLASRQSDLLGAKGALTAQEYLLKQLLSDDFLQWENVGIEPTDTLRSEPSTLNRHESWKRGLTLRPDLLQAQLHLERQGIVLTFLHNQMFPQLDLVGSYGHVGSGRDYYDALGGLRRGDSPFYSFGAVLSIPLAGNRSARGSFRAAKVERGQSLLALKQLEQDIMIQIGIAIEQAETRYGQVASTMKSRLFAETALEAEQRKLENGRTTSFVVLQLQRDLTASRLAEQAALAEYNKSLAQLALREGTTLERNQLELRFN